MAAYRYDGERCAIEIGGIEHLQLAWLVAMGVAIVAMRVSGALADRQQVAPVGADLNVMRCDGDVMCGRGAFVHTTHPVDNTCEE